MEPKKLFEVSSNLDSSVKMPALFLGHGSPMNAIEENEFIMGFKNLAYDLETPKAILVISAHWETKGTYVSSIEKPPTIHDFIGFPKELYTINYSAPGSPFTAQAIKNAVNSSVVNYDFDRGFDHGAWSVLMNIYPKANIPVVQLSLDFSKTPQQHYDLAKELYHLRKKGVLIVGSGNLVHNLSMIAWDKINENFGYNWAIEAMELMKQFIVERKHQNLINYSKLGKAFELSIPTPEHFLPLLYILAIQDENEKISFFNDQSIAGSLSMTSVKVG